MVAAFWIIHGWYWPKVELYVFWHAPDSLSSGLSWHNCSKNRATKTGSKLISRGWSGYVFNKILIILKALWRRRRVLLPEMYLESVNLFSLSSWRIIFLMVWKCWAVSPCRNVWSISSLLVTSEDTKPNTVPISPKNLHLFCNVIKYLDVKT